MNAQLLLLLALAGPFFCAFTHASPTEIPTDLDVGVDETVGDADVTEAPEADLSVITGRPATEPAAAAEEEVATEEQVVATTEEAMVTEAVTAEEAEAATTAVFFTERAVVETDAPAAATEAPVPVITDHPVVETAGPTEPPAVEVQPTGAAKAVDDVVVEEDPEEGLSSGQVVGIVIGALLAVVIVIAVVIAAVRRMGKYSP